MTARFTARAISPRLVLLAMLCCWALPARAAPDMEGATRVIEAFHGALLEIMKGASKTNAEQRFRLMSSQIGRSFDTGFMTRVIAGSSWKTANGTQRATLSAAFKRMSAAVYAARFDGYSGQSFKTLKTRSGPRRTVLVHTHLIRPRDTPVKLVYVMKKRQAGWRIIDVILAGGISELALRYSESRQVLRKKGIAGLVASLDAMARRMLGEE